MVTKIIEDMKGKTTNFIKDVQEEAANFNDNFRVYANEEFERVNALLNDEDKAQEAELEFQNNDTFLELMAEADTLKQVLENSKENLETKIGEKEDQVSKGLTNDWQMTYQNIMEEQHKRNRNVIENIITKCEGFREELGKYFVCVFV